MNLDCDHKHQQRMLKEIGVKTPRPGSMTHTVRLLVLCVSVGISWIVSNNGIASFNDEFKKKTGINPKKPLPKISVNDVNNEIKKKTGLNPAKPYPKISVNDINNEIKKKFGVDPQTPLGTAGDNWLFKGWKPLRQPVLPVERAADQAMSALKEGEKWTVLFLDSLFLNRHWPDGFPNQPIKRLANPSVELTLQKETIDAATALYKGEIIPLAGSDYLEIGTISVTLDPDRNLYVIDISGGKLVYKFIRENSFHIKSTSFQAIPVIGLEKDRIVLDLCIRCVHLDVEDCPGEIDRFIAFAIDEGLEASHGNIIAKLDLSHLLAEPIEMKTRSNSVARPHLNEATAFINGQSITAQIAFDFVKTQKIGP